LKFLFAKFVEQADQWPSMEIDSNKLEPGGDLEANKTQLIEKVRSVLNTITSSESIDKMPEEIKYELVISIILKKKKLSLIIIIFVFILK